MPLDPRLWYVAPYLRRFPDEVADVYEAEDTPLVDVYELWGWKWDLYSPSPMGHRPDSKKIAKRLGDEVSDFLRIEEESRTAEKQARLELALERLSQIVKRHCS